jgi:hypothetical protein
VKFANIDGRKKYISNIMCFNCQKIGHYANAGSFNTEPNKMVGATMPMLEEEDSNRDTDYDSAGQSLFNQGRSKYINPHWILLNIQSTAGIFCNPNLPSDIHRSGKSIKVHCNSRTSLVTQVGTLKNYGEVWYNAIANILSLAGAKERYTSDEGNQFIMIQPTKKVVFQQSGHNKRWECSRISLGERL